MAATTRPLARLGVGVAMVPSVMTAAAATYLRALTEAGLAKGGAGSILCDFAHLSFYEVFARRLTKSVLLPEAGAYGRYSTDRPLSASATVSNELCTSMCPL